jgi:3-isopropylmalate/(R)-2-methylmalate dehydratase large subunit
MSGQTMTEKILGEHAQLDAVRPGDLVVVRPDVVVALDLNFYDGQWAEPAEVFDPERIVVVLDHIVPAPNKKSAEFLARARRFARRVGIDRVHDVGPRQGICHQLIADVPYARPGELLACVDSHTCSAGALNCAARGIGGAELIYVMVKGLTWFQVAPTIRYELDGELPLGATAKDAFLHIAGVYGDHVGHNVEFGGPGMATLNIDQRRTMATMCAEISAEFAIFEPDDVLHQHMVERGVDAARGVLPDADADYADVRSLDLSEVEPMVGLPHELIGNTVPLREASGRRVDRAFIGSCANGTLADLHQAAEVLAGHQVHSDVTLLITPGSQEIYQQALQDGTIEILTSAGALVTTASCSMCAGFINALAAEEVCISSSTRNFRGRMGSSDAEIYLASSATVAATAVAGEIIDPRHLAAEPLVEHVR